ncbi:MAG: rhomboid family intramembrane serine protease [Sandaracinaceae bacterium]|nr:rhomboid family intramembrane serine protease [Sandaracinaceae bacterium]
MADKSLFFLDASHIKGAESRKMLPLRDTIPSRRTPFVTWLLIAINVFVFLFELSLEPKELHALFYLFGIVPARYSHPQWAHLVGFPLNDYSPFITSMFLHGGWSHIVSNMWTLWIFGDNVEDRMGHLRYLLFYLITGIIAGLTHSFVYPNSTIPTVGASGAIAGVLGAYFLLFPNSQIITMLPLFFFPIFFTVPAFAYLLIWLVTQLMGGTFAEEVSGIAFWAHVGGFLSGAILHPIFIPKHRRKERPFEEDEYGIEGSWM